MIKACAFGEIFINLSTERDRPFRALPESIDYSYFSNEINFLADVINLGGRGYLLSAVPNNFIGSSIIKRIKSLNINTKLIKKSGNARIPIIFFEKGLEHRSSNIYIDRIDSMIDNYKYKDFPFNLVFSKSNLYFISGLAPSLSKEIMYIIISSARLAKEMGLEVSLNLNYDSNFWKYDINGERVKPEKIISDIAVYCDYLFCFEKDIKEYFGIDISNKFSKYDKVVHYQNLLLQLSKRFPHIKIIGLNIKNVKRDGSTFIGGAIYLRESNQFYFSPNIYNKFKPLLISENIEINGEIEAFSSGFLFGLKKNSNLQMALDFAVASLALKYSYKDGINYSTIKDILNLINSIKFKRLRKVNWK